MFSRLIKPGNRRLPLICPLAFLLACGGLGDGSIRPQGGSNPLGSDWPIRQWEASLLRSRERAAGESQDKSRTYKIQRGDTFWSVARRYSLSPYRLMQVNPKYLPERLPIGAILRLPAEAGKPRPVTGQSAWHWPIGGRITSRYGWRWGRMHRGVDIAAPPGTLIRAAEQGQVTIAGWRSGYGLYVVLTHPGGWRTAYAHNSRLLVHAGQHVSSGTALAKIGATGNATGIHLHFEIIGPGGYIDPLRVLR